MNGAVPKPAVAESIFFLSDVIGRKVYNNGIKIGKLADMVVIDIDKVAEVTHLVVDRPFGDPSLLVPWNKVTNFAAKIEIGLETLTQYEAKPSEGMILLDDHLLDKKILDMEGSEVEVVYDMQLVLRNNKLYVTAVDSSRYGLLRRIGLGKFANFIYGLANKIRRETIPWSYVEHLPEDISSFKGNLTLKVLKDKLADIQPVDMADILEELNNEQRVAIFKQLDTEHASDTLEEIEPRVQRELISALKDEKVAELLNQMTPAQAADILSILPSQDANKIIKLLNEKSSKQVQLILREQDQKNIHFATSKYIKFPPQTKVNQVLNDLRTILTDKDVIMYIYVVDQQDQLIGVLDLRELLAAKPDETLENIMNPHVFTMDADSTLMEAAEEFKHYGFRAIPLVDENKKILGVITYRDVQNLKRLFFIEE
jgi:magnesium transporter